jgi:hypothetical protein
VHVAQHVDSVAGHRGSVAVASGVEGMPVRAFRVTLPSGERYWTVVDHEYRVVGDVDEYLRHLRFGQDSAESTTKAYAESLALYLRWCERSERDWRTGAERLGAFVTWLKHTPSDPEALSVAMSVLPNSNNNSSTDARTSRTATTNLPPPAPPTAT